jgi:hypothetical protein
VKSRILIGLLIVLAPLRALADEAHPRLFLNQRRIEQIQSAIRVPRSHHQQAFNALKVRVNQNNWRVYDGNPNDGNWNYARSYQAREAALLYLLTNENKYAQIAYEALNLIHQDPDPDNRLPEAQYGLSRATVGQNFALAYDWAYRGWTPQQRDYIKGKINLALDAWENFRHANLSNPAMASNWVAVCRGGELVMMLAVYEEGNRANRYTQLKQWLKTHLFNAYGELGLSQEGIGYDSYAGIFLVPAVYALQSVGDGDLDANFAARHFWKLVMYAGAFTMNESGDRYFLQSGVSGAGIGDEGWTSLLLGSVPPRLLPFYRYFYDRHMGIDAPGTPAEKFDKHRGATIWSLIYYPESAPSFNPTGLFPSSVGDEKRGAYFFRDRWQDENDILVSVMADSDRHRNAWDQSEAFQLGLLAYNTHFIGGPAKISGNPATFSTLLVDGKAQRDRGTTGKSEFFNSTPDGGYVIIDGGEKYASLGLRSAKRHLLVNFSETDDTGVLATLHRIRDEEKHTYTWQLNLGNEKGDGGVTATVGMEGGLPTFLLRGDRDSYLKGWVLHPKAALVTAGDPLQVSISGANAEIWIATFVGRGIPPVATVTGTGMATVLEVGNVRLRYDANDNRMIAESRGDVREVGNTFPKE